MSVSSLGDHPKTGLVFADIRRHRGDARNIIGNFASVEGANVDWLLRPDQTYLSPPGTVIGYSEQFDPVWVNRVRDRIVQLAQNDAGGSFWVFSYDALVRATAEKLNDAGIKVICRSPAELIAEASAQKRPFSRPAPTHTGSTASPEGRLTIQEATEIAKTVLRSGRHWTKDNPLNLASLRLKMAAIDNRARKWPGDLESENLITEVVRVGHREHWLSVFKRIPEKAGSEAIYLLGANSSAIPAPEIVAVPAEPSASPPVVARTNMEFAATQAHTPPLPKKHPNRATPFEAELSRLRIGSMPQTREITMDAVECALKTAGDDHPTLSALFTAAAKISQQKASESSYTNEANWSIATKCIQRLMLRAGVIIGGNQRPVRDELGSTSSRVISLIPDFRRTCEIYMAEQIIRSTGGISYKADELLVRMKDDGLIEMCADGFIRLRSASLGTAA